MKKVFLIAIAMFLAISMFATITYSTIVYSSVPTSSPLFYKMSSSTTVVVADTAAKYIDSTPFTSAKLSNATGVEIVGTVSTACQHTASTAVGMLRPEILVSIDGTNYTSLKIFYGYETSAATAGIVCFVPTTILNGIYAPYVKIRWHGLSAAGVIYTAKIFGVIKTDIIVKK